MLIPEQVCKGMKVTGGIENTGLPEAVLFQGPWESLLVP